MCSAYKGKDIPLHSRGAVTAILDCLASLPKVVLDARASLYVRYATVSLVAGQTTRVEERLQAAESALQGAEADDKTHHPIGQTATVGATFTLARYQPEAMVIHYFPRHRGQIGIGLRFGSGNSGATQAGPDRLQPAGGPIEVHRQVHGWTSHGERGLAALSTSIHTATPRRHAGLTTILYSANGPDMSNLQKTLGREGRRQHHHVDVPVPFPSLGLPTIRIAPKAFDFVGKRRISLQLGDDGIDQRTPEESR
jgi:hypothetical protein